MFDFGSSKFWKIKFETFETQSQSKNVSNCNERSICRNTFGSYACDCIAGYEAIGFNLCIDKDECMQGSFFKVFLSGQNLEKKFKRNSFVWYNWSMYKYFGLFSLQLHARPYIQRKFTRNGNLYY